MDIRCTLALWMSLLHRWWLCEVLPFYSACEKNTVVVCPTLELYFAILVSPIPIRSCGKRANAIHTHPYVFYSSNALVLQSGEMSTRALYLWMMIFPCAFYWNKSIRNWCVCVCIYICIYRSSYSYICISRSRVYMTERNVCRWSIWSY